MSNQIVDLDKLDTELTKWRGEISLPVEVIVTLSEELRLRRNECETQLAQLAELHEQVAQMCEHLGSKREEDPCDTWHLRDLITRFKSHAELDDDGWRLLFSADNVIMCDEGNEYLFAVNHVLVNDPEKRVYWEYFTDSLVWDSETEPTWGDGGHGFDIDDVTHFRSKPTAPEISP